MNGGNGALVACWAVKGGSGTTVFSAALGMALAKAEPPGVLLADLAGELPAALGLADSDTGGMSSWLRGGPGSELTSLETTLPSGLSLLSRGPGRLRARRVEALADALRGDRRTVIVDCGTFPRGLRAAIVSRASCSLLVTRPCFLALRRVAFCPCRPTGVVLVREPGRVLGRSDVELVVGAPVVGEIEVDPAVARAVDAGLLATPRLPGSLASAMDDIWRKLGELLR